MRGQNKREGWRFSLNLMGNQNKREGVGIFVKFNKREGQNEHGGGGVGVGGGGQSEFQNIR